MWLLVLRAVPIIRGGVVTLSSGDSSTPSRSIRITRIQLEQDSGKSLHDLHPTRSFVDFNRAGVGLMEIVSEPDMRTSDEAVSYIRKLSSLLQALGTCRAHMEEGSLRADVNISIRRPGGEYGERVEVKNLNSLRSLQRAIEHEVSRQIALSTAGQPVRRETRSFDAKTGETALLRAKEQLLDYRFAPEPDLPPLILQPSHISSLHASLPELPAARFQRFRTEYSLTEYDAGVLLAEQGAAEYMDRLVYGEEGWKGGKVAQRMIRSPKKCANWLANELFGRLKKMKQSSSNSSPDDDLDVDDGLSSDWPGSFLGGGSRSPSLSSSPITSAALGELVDLVEEGKISGKVGKEVMEVMMRPLVEGEVRKTPAQIVRENGWAQVTDDALIARLCEEVVAKFPEEVQAVLGGNKRLFGFLSGQVLKLSGSKEAGEKNSGSGGGKLNPAAVSKRLTQVIEEKRAAK